MSAHLMQPTREQHMFSPTFSQWQRRAADALASTALVLALAAAPEVQAQSDASLMLSALPIASVVVGTAASVGASTSVVALPVALSVDGARLIVKGVQASAKGTVWLLESASDGAAASIELSAGALGASAAGVGTAIFVSVVGAGVLLSAAGEVIAFIPNEVGKALLYNERL
ncbi:hypothetical protein GCM10027195_12500 [Comamonas sediminis]